MSLNVYQPQKRFQTVQTAGEANPLARLLTIGGLAAGAATGTGPAGMATGAATGAGLGGLVGSLIGGGSAPSSKQIEAPPTPEPVQTGGDSMKRKLGDMTQTSNNLNQISASIDSLKFVKDEDLRMKLAQPLLQAYNASQKEGQA